MLVKIPVSPQINGSYNALQYPSTVITRLDTTVPTEQLITSSDFSLNLPIISPKGPTNKLVVFQGTDCLNKFVKLFGKPLSSRIYGKNMSYAFHGVKSGFALTTANVRSANSTYANYIYNFRVRNTDNAGNIHKKVLWIELDPLTNYYHMNYDKSKLPGVNPQVNTDVFFYEIKVETLYESNLTDITQCFKDLTTNFTTSVPSTPVVDTVDVSIPISGLVYSGAGNYGNNYNIVNTYTTSYDSTFEYPVYTTNISDGTSLEYPNNYYTLTETTYAGSSLYYLDIMNTNLSMQTNTINGNDMVTVFESFMQESKVLHEITPIINKIIAKTKIHFEASIKSVFPSFNLLNQGDHISILAETEALQETFRVSDDLTKNETPISHFNILKTVNPTLGLYLITAGLNNIKLDGGFDPLTQTMKTKGFDWKYTPDNGVSYPFIDIFKNYYEGRISNALFDPTYAPDAILICDNYDRAVQESVLNLVNSPMGAEISETKRTDFTAILNKPIDMTNDEWIASLPYLTLTPNIVKVLGSFKFKESNSGVVDRYMFFFEYFLDGNSELLSYLKSGTKNAFGYGNYSLITKAVGMSEEDIPSTSIDKTKLTDQNCMFLERRDNGLYGLAFDTSSKFKGKVSVLQNLGSIILFNKLQYIGEITMRSNRILTIDLSNPSTNPEFPILVSLVNTRQARFVRHFNNVTNTIYYSTHPLEKDKFIPILEIYVEGNTMSYRNRVQVVSSNVPKI